jgi:pentatricopeptide repeat protein
VQWTLKAASTTANVKSAIEIVKIMKMNNIEPSKEIYNSLIRVYAKACDIPDITESYREMMLMDTWKILEEIISKNMVDTVIINNVM